MSDKVTQHPKNSSRVIKQQKPETVVDGGINLHHNTAQVAGNFTTNDVLRLQRTLGNQATLNLLRKAEAKKEQAKTDEAGKGGDPQISDAEHGIVQRAVNATGAPTELDPVADAVMIQKLEAQYVTFQQNIIKFWDNYKLPHPPNEQALFQHLWGLYLDGLKQSSVPQSKLATVKGLAKDDKKANTWVPGKINTRGAKPSERQKIDAPVFKSILGYHSVPHPDAKPRTKEEKELAAQMGVMRMQYAEEAIVKMQGLVAAFAKEFDKAIAKVKENADQANKDRPWYKVLSKKKKPNYIFWSGGSASRFVEHKHSPDDTIMLEMTMGKMAWLNGLGSKFGGVDANGDDIRTPNDITAYTGENFQIWTALSEKYAFTAAMQAQRGQKWNFLGYMSDIPVDEQSVYNTIERPTILNEVGADLNITWRMIDVDPKYIKKFYKEELDTVKSGNAVKEREWPWPPTDKLILVKESKNRGDIVNAIRKAEEKKKAAEDKHQAMLKAEAAKAGKKTTP